MSQEDKSAKLFHDLSAKLRKAVESCRDIHLLSELEEFLSAYSGDNQKLPRLYIELLKAQMLLRRILIATKNYGVVYDWYAAFKNPYGENVEQSIEYYTSSIREGAKAYRWIEGHDAVIECGCGAAALGFSLALCNRRWIASDIVYPPAFDKLKAFFSPGPAFEYLCADGTTLKGVPDNSIDVVLSRSFFEHLLVEDALTHLSSAFRVLKQGGKLIIACPAGVGPPSDITNQFPEYDTPQGLHIKEYRIGELAKMLRDAGFLSVSSRFIRTRFIGSMPLFVQCRNFLPIPIAASLESAASSTWPLLKKSQWGRTLWKKIWGHLGASGITVLAEKSGSDNARISS